MVTIFDVAKEAHVSKSTVSRVVNKDPAVKDATRRSVEEAIQRLNYAPSFFAKGIRTGQTKTIAFLIPEYANLFYGEMFNGVEEMALKHGYMVLVCNTGHAISEKDYIQRLLSRNIDGIIYNTYEFNPDVMEFLKELSREMPIICMDEIIGRTGGLSSVYTDGYSSSKKAVQFLAGQGCMQIGYIRTKDSINATKYRFQGYLDGLKECNITFNPDFVYPCQMDNEINYIKAGMQAGTYFAGLKCLPQGLMASIDLLALGCITQLTRCNIRVPQDISVIGFDNIELGEVATPSLTTIAQQTKEMGRQAAKIVIEQLQSQKIICEQKVYEGNLILRETTVNQRKTNE